jgi:NADH-quinone oxidoreductase subunit H
MVVAFFFIFIRANLPRYRYDQLMAVGWEVILPMSLAYLLFIGGVLRFTVGEPEVNTLPYLNIGSLLI